MSQRRRLASLLVVVPLLLSAGCTGKNDAQSGGSSGSSSAARTTTPESGPTSAGASPTDEVAPSEADFPADTSGDGGPAQSGSVADPAGQMHVSGIRIASKQGYTRVVIDLSSKGVPAWTARYTEASGPGGGPVDIEGDAFLRVTLQTGAAPNGQVQADSKVSPGPIAEAKTTGYFEGSEEVLIGTRGGQVPFRAFALTDPGRIVIDARPAG